MFAACFRYNPPVGFGIMPLLVTLESAVQTRATLFLLQDLHNIPMVCLSKFAVSIFLFEVQSLKNLVKL
jgi:hypothetical protein